MDFEQASAITASIVRCRLHSMGIGTAPDLDLLRRTSLADMVQANAVVVAENARRTREKVLGQQISHQVTADDRLTAAVYTALHFDAEDQHECEPIMVLDTDGANPSYLVHIFTDKE